MAAVPVRPRVHALVVCDEIVPGSEEDVYDLVGVRTWLGASSFPYTHPQFCVYLQVTGHQGDAVCRIEVVHSEREEDVLAAVEGEMEFHGPLEFVVSDWRIEGCPFPEAGLYYVQVSFDGRLAGERMLFLLERGVLGNGQGTD
jgi:hypothetical protein